MCSFATSSKDRSLTIVMVPAPVCSLKQVQLTAARLECLLPFGTCSKSRLLQPLGRVLALYLSRRSFPNVQCSGLSLGSNYLSVKCWRPFIASIMTSGRCGLNGDIPSLVECCTLLTANGRPRQDVTSQETLSFISKVRGAIDYQWTPSGRCGY